MITAWSAAVSAGVGATVTSNWRVPYSARNEFRPHAGGAHRRDQALAEGTLAAERVQAVGIAVAVLVAGIDELLFERGDKLQPGCRIERGDRAAEELARAAFPRRAVGIADVAKEEVLRRGAIGEIHPHLGRRIGYDHQIAGGAERRVEDRPERRLHQVGVSPADALATSRIDVAGRKPLAPDMAGDVAGTDEDQFLAQHGVLLSSM